MRRAKWKIAVTILLFVCLARADERTELLKSREAVWRAWFANDVVTLHNLVPPETIVISAGEPKWKNQSEVFAAAADFQRQGGRLVSLEFPRTDVQMFGHVAVIYSRYALELEVGGKIVRQSGRVTEVFVRRNGHWLNPGWHTDEEK
jgi:hypothetical protein